MLKWLRKRRAERTIPDALWHAVLARYPFLSARPQPELQRLRQLAARFLATKEFHGAQGFVITDAVALAIAAQAVLPVLNLGLSWYDDFVGIVVHRGEVVAKRTVTDDDGVVHDYHEVLAGEAMDRGPVMLSWTDVESAGATAEQGYNVVIHEFIHKIDMRDGQPDGCPPLPSRTSRRAWLAVMQAEYEAFREKVIIAERFGGEAPWLDAYGAQAIDEFFAVACEAYFVNRPRFEADFPALAPLLDSFFKGPAAS
ncbi:MAG TPA: M90 family metallopeptidase [Ramlibacter sp.]|nr:M90 family metallopeptidase [Ramlibacter sp.]